MYTNIHILQLLRRHNMWSMRNQTFQAVLDKHQRGWVCRNGLGLFREGFTMTVWDQTISLTTGRGLGGKDGGRRGREVGGQLLPTADFIFFHLAILTRACHPSPGRWDSCRQCCRCCCCCCCRWLVGERRYVKFYSNSGVIRERSAVTHSKCDSLEEPEQKVVGGGGEAQKKKDKNRGGLKDSHYYFQNLNLFQAAAQLSGGWRISIGNVCNLLRNQVPR